MENQPTKTFLIVDDEPAIVSLLTDILTLRGGYRVISATSADEAVQKYQLHHPEIALVILDMNMPGSSGLEAFFRLKEVNPSVRALLVTGSGRQDQISDALAGGIVGYVQKPFRMHELLQKIKTLVGEI